MTAKEAGIEEYTEFELYLIKKWEKENEVTIIPTKDERDYVTPSRYKFERSNDENNTM